MVWSRDLITVKLESGSSLFWSGIMTVLVLVDVGKLIIIRPVVFEERRPERDFWQF